MNRFRLIPWVLAGLGPGALTIPALASVESAAGSPEACVTAPDAQAWQDRVAQGLLPRVMFSGETAPAPVQARMAAHRVPAFSVAVIRAGTLDWSAAWGRQQADGAATTCRSLFQAGSLAKPATVLAAWRMQQAGVIDLDADVDAYLTPWKLPAGRQDAEHPVTLRRLFAHTAGITPGGTRDTRATPSCPPTCRPRRACRRPTRARRKCWPCRARPCAIPAPVTPWPRSPCSNTLSDRSSR